MALDGPPWRNSNKIERIVIAITAKVQQQIPDTFNTPLPRNDPYSIILPTQYRLWGWVSKVALSCRLLASVRPQIKEN